MSYLAKVKALVRPVEPPSEHDTKKGTDTAGAQLPPSPQRTPNGDAILPLPWKLERLVAAASSGVLPIGTVLLDNGFVNDLNAYTLTWAASYLIGDRDDALRRLWAAHNVWRLRG